VLVVEEIGDREIGAALLVDHERHLRIVNIEARTRQFFAEPMQYNRAVTPVLCIQARRIDGRNGRLGIAIERQ
jgi:hypothetical protein